MIYSEDYAAIEIAAYVNGMTEQPFDAETLVDAVTQAVQEAYE